MINDLYKKAFTFSVYKHVLAYIQNMQFIYAEKKNYKKALPHLFQFVKTF